MVAKRQAPKSFAQWATVLFWTAFGAFLTAFALEAFLIPHDIIDGGVIGVAMIFGALFGKGAIPLFFMLLNLPFIYLGLKSIGKSIVVHMAIAGACFVGFLSLFTVWHPFVFQGEMLEVIVVGGLILGGGVGMVIRAGGCLDGTEILAILMSKRYGFTVGQIILAVNICIFTLAGLVFGDWHPPIYSFMTFVVAIQIMDKVIAGLDETKSVTILSKHSSQVAKAIVHEMGLGCTIINGRGGFSGEPQELLYVIIERLELGELKDLVFQNDPDAFITVETLHELSHGGDRDPKAVAKPRRKRKTTRKKG